jgi:membrane protease YdiL (CAAX protease family)
MNKSLSLFYANLLLAVTMLLVITLGSTVQSLNLSWGLIATEVFLIALPALLFLRLGGVPLRSGLRLTRISLPTGMTCVALGVAMYLFGALIDGIMVQLSGLPSVAMQNELLPKTGGQMVVYFAALAIFAPLGEEVLFRGAIQGAYERRKPAAFAITITALMFAFYHFRLTGLPALLPIAFVLSYVVWRTGSIFAGMLIHFGNNAASAVQNIFYFSTGKGLAFLSLWTALAGLAVAIVLLVLISRLHPRPARAATRAAEAIPTTPNKSWLATYWPLGPAWVLYIAVSGMTVLGPLLAQPALSSEVSYGVPSLQSPVLSHYVAADKGGREVGEMSCLLTPSSVQLKLNCTGTTEAYEYSSGNSFYKDGRHTTTLAVTWDGQTFNLTSFSLKKVYDNDLEISSTVNNSMLVSSVSDGSQETALPEHSLLEYEWAWHTALLKGNSGQTFSVPFGYLMAWNESQKKSMPQVKNEVMRVYDDETLRLPRGDRVVRKVSVGNFSAWFARNDALAGLPRPVKFDDGMVVYTLGD